MPLENIYSTFHNRKIYYKSAQLFTSNTLLSLCDICLIQYRQVTHIFHFCKVKKIPYGFLLAKQESDFIFLFKTNFGA